MGLHRKAGLWTWRRNLERPTVPIIPGLSASWDPGLWGLNPESLMQPGTPWSPRWNQGSPGPPAFLAQQGVGDHSGPPSLSALGNAPPPTLPVPLLRAETTLSAFFGFQTPQCF